MDTLTNQSSRFMNYSFVDQGVERQRKLGPSHFGSLHPLLRAQLQMTTMMTTTMMMMMMKMTTMTMMMMKMTTMTMMKMLLKVKVHRMKMTTMKKMKILVTSTVVMVVLLSRGLFDDVGVDADDDDDDGSAGSEAGWPPIVQL